MSDLQVQAELRLKDNISKQAGTALDHLEKAAKKASHSADAIGKGGSSKKVATDAAEAAKNLRTMEQSAAGAERNLKNAERGAQGLSRTMGKVNTNSRDALKHMQTMGRTLSSLTKGAGEIGGGLMASGYVAKNALQKPVAYESQLASMANVAYADRDTSGRLAGMKSLDASIVEAMRAGGGSRDQAASALNTMLAAGTEESTAKKLLPMVQKASTASGADANELAMILVKGISQKQFTADEATAAIDKAIKAGEAGQFELKDMARWLPQIISAGKGMKGMGGFEAHLANLQGIANVTGSNDQAGNAYFNLLGKITSTDAAANFKKKGINLPKALAKATEAGTDPVAAFVELIQSKVINKNKSYQALQKKINASKDVGERKQLMEQAAELLQGSAVGTIIQDREALLGLVGIMSQKDYIADVKGQLGSAEGSMDKSFSVMASTSDFKLQQASNEKDIAATGFLDTIKAPMDAAVSGIRDFAEASPKLATAAYGVATALGAITAGGAVSSGMAMLGGKGLASAATGTAGTAASAASAGGGATVAGGGLGGTAAKVASKAALPLAMAGAAYDIYSTENDATKTREQKNISNMQTYGGFGGMLAGAAMGGAAGSVVPILGNAIGALLGGVAGYFAGGMAGKGVGEMAWGNSGDTAPPLPDANIKQDITLTVELDGQKVAELIEQRQSRESLRQ